MIDELKYTRLMQYYTGVHKMVIANCKIAVDRQAMIVTTAHDVTGVYAWFSIVKMKSLTLVVCNLGHIIWSDLTNHCNSQSFKMGKT